MFSKAVIGGFLISAALSQGYMAPSEVVPLLGPSFSSNFDPANYDVLRNAPGVLEKKIESLFDRQALDRDGLIFSIDVFSAASNKSVYAYQHVGKSQERALTAPELNQQTSSRIGSVTKLFTVYALLVKAGIEVFDHPVTRYMPELAGNSSESQEDEHIDWEKITIGALASHQAGSGGATGLLEGSREGSPPPTAEDLITYMRDEKRPVIAPYSKAIYSDGGFAILTEVLVRLCGQGYEDSIQELLLKPLGMNRTSTFAPKGEDINTIDRSLVSNMTSFGEDVPVVAGSGGLYSSIADLRSAGLSILNSELLSSNTIRRWMKPLSGTGSLVQLVGAPWEISRLAIPVTSGASHTRVSDLYTKAGGTGDYTCVLALSPDHGIGFSILVAGDTASQARWPLRDAVGEVFVPALEGAAATHAEQNFAGTFVDKNSQGTNVTLSVDDDQPGIGLKSFFVDGIDIRALFLGEAEASPVNASMRLYPTRLHSNPDSLASLYKVKGTVEISYRLVSIRRPYEPRAASEGGMGGLFDNQPYWMTVGFRESIDEFKFTITDTRLVTIESIGMQHVFERDG